jgi:hypothetical protein
MMACLAGVGQAQPQRWLFATKRCDGVSVMWACLVRIVAIRRSVLPVAGVDVDIGGCVSSDAAHVIAQTPAEHPHAGAAARAQPGCPG